MAFLLEKKNGSAIQLQGGFEVPNCVVRFTTNFDRFGNFYLVNIYYYKDQSEQNECPSLAGVRKYENIKFDISEQDYMLLNPIEVHNRVKTWFEGENPEYKLTMV
jgi:hypothetical protein